MEWPLGLALSDNDENRHITRSIFYRYRRPEYKTHHHVSDCLMRVSSCHVMSCRCISFTLPPFFLLAFALISRCLDLPSPIAAFILCCCVCTYRLSHLTSLHELLTAILDLCSLLAMGYGDGTFREPDVFVATALKLAWFPADGFPVRDLIHLIGQYLCRFGTMLWLLVYLACAWGDVHLRGG